jgi:hypothetical protein
MVSNRLALRKCDNGRCEECDFKIRDHSRYGERATPCIVTFPLPVVLTHEIVKV